MIKSDNWSFSFLHAMCILVALVACYGWAQRPTFLKELIVSSIIVGALGVLTVALKLIFFRKDTDPDREVI